MDVMKSANRSLHSTETDLLKVQNNVLSALNEGSAVVLLMLDLLHLIPLIIRSCCHFFTTRTVLEVTFMLSSNHTCLIEPSVLA